MERQIKKRLYKKRQQMTGKGIARKLRVSESYVSLMLSGKRKPTKNFLKIINKIK